MDNVTWFALFLGVVGYLAAKLIENLIYFLRSGTSTIETRRDTDLKDIESLIFETRDLACDYWCLPATSPKKLRMSASITGRFTFLASRIALLFGPNSSDTKSIINILYLFMNACTGEDFFIGHGAPGQEDETAAAAGLSGDLARAQSEEGGNCSGDLGAHIPANDNGPRANFEEIAVRMIESANTAEFKEAS